VNDLLKLTGGIKYNKSSLAGETFLFIFLKVPPKLKNLPYAIPFRNILFHPSYNLFTNENERVFFIQKVSLVQNI